MRHKRGMAEKTIIALIIIIFSFMVILGVIRTIVAKADDITAELICRGSVATRAKYNFEKLDEKVSFAPLLCRTIHKNIPLTSKEASKEIVQKDMAELIRRCWWQFGQGLVSDLFDDKFGAGYKNSCFVCYSFRLEDKNYPITKNEFEKFLSQEKIQKKSYDEKSDEFTEADPQKAYSYREYVQSSGGKGNIIINTEQFTPKEKTYAVAIISPKYFTTFEAYKKFVDLFVTDKHDFEYIFIDELDNINQRCEIVDDVASS